MWIEWVLREAAALVSVSGSLAERLRQLGAPESKISVLRNGVDLKLFAPGDRAALRCADRCCCPSGISSWTKAISWSSKRSGNCRI
jgi:hypothetical protein